jgi:very-short-patch-repair endonuclease
VIELDGGVHDGVEQQEHDFYRDQIIQEFGIRVLRFKNEEVVDGLQKVLERIRAVLP